IPRNEWPTRIGWSILSASSSDQSFSLNRCQVTDQQIDSVLDLLWSGQRHEGTCKRTRPEHESIPPHWHLSCTMRSDFPRSYNVIMHLARWKNSVVALRQKRQVSRFPL